MCAHGQHILLLKHIQTLEGDLFHSKLYVAHIWYRSSQLCYVPREAEKTFTIIIKNFLLISHIVLSQTLFKAGLKKYSNYWRTPLEVCTT